MKKLIGRMMAALIGWGLGGALFASAAVAGSANTELCQNRSAFVTLNRRYVDEVRTQFLMINSLPFEVRALPASGDLATLQISYRRLTPGDHFSEPLSMELGQRVFEMLKGDLKKFQIRKIWAEFDSDLGC